MKHENIVGKRMKEIAKQQGKKAVDIGKLGGLRQSTMSDILLGKNQYPKINTIIKFCDGAGMTLTQFFDSDIFRQVNTPEKEYRRTKKETVEDN